MIIIFLEVIMPDWVPQLGGFVVIDRNNRRASVRFRCSWDQPLDKIDAQVLSGSRRIIESFFENLEFEKAVSAVLELSNVIRATSELRIPSATTTEILADKLAELLLN